MRVAQHAVRAAVVFFAASLGGVVATTDTSGMTWVGVARVQCGLNAHGAHLAVDGKWGPHTDDAMIAFIGHNFDYGYSAPPDGAAVVRVTPALARVLQCPATAPATIEQPPASSSIGWLVAGALAATGIALLVWGVPRA